MPNGKPGDHPLTDMLAHGQHPFPPDIEGLLRQILALDPQFPDGSRAYVEQVEWDRRFRQWARGEGVAEGKRDLERVLHELQPER